MAKELPRRSTGNVMEPGDGYLPNGKPDLSPSAGYVAAEPVQYSDESDTQFAGRVLQWEESKATAMEIQSASGSTQDTLEARRGIIEKRYEKEMAAIDAEEKRLK